MNAVLSVQDTAVSEETKPSFLSRVFNKKKALKVAKVALPVAALAAFFPDAAMATTTATDLMKSGDSTVKGTFGKSSSVVKWVVLAEVVAGGIMYMMTKNGFVNGMVASHLLCHSGTINRHSLNGALLS